MTATRIRPLTLLLICLSLAACERLGIPDPAKTEAQAEGDGKAIGSACRHAGRAIEDCFTLNPSAPKAAVFAGWKEMNDYMAENKIEAVAPQLPPPPPPGSGKPASKSKAAEGAKDKEGGNHGSNKDDQASSADEGEAEVPHRRRKSAE